MRKYIRVIFTKKKKFNIFSWAIRKVLRTKYSHVAVEIFDGNHLHLYEASAFGVRKIAKPFFEKENMEIFAKVIEVKNVEEVVDFCEDYLGAPYSFKSILGLFIKLVFNIHNGLGVDGIKTAICSEFAVRVLLTAGILKHVKSIDHMTPKQLYALTRSIN